VVALQEQVMDLAAAAVRLILDGLVQTAVVVVVMVNTT
jgi:hypothetical protein